jgi:hypothetical protein
MNGASLLRFKTTLSMLCFAMLAFASQASAADVSIEGTSLRLPETLAGFSRGEVHKYSGDASGTGTAVSYHSEFAEADFFIRPLDAAEAGMNAEDLVRDSLAVVLELQERGVYTDVKKFESTDTTGSEWKSGAYLAKKDRVPITSFIYCRVFERRSLKIRLTSFNIKETPGHLKFIEELRKLVDAALKRP